jgi:hypothetical protein
LRKFNESIAVKVLENNNLMNRNNEEIIPYDWQKFLEKFNNISSKLKA